MIFNCLRCGSEHLKCIVRYYGMDDTIYYNRVCLECGNIHEIDYLGFMGG
jgi:transcription elongation factor Elf1